MKTDNFEDDIPLALAVASFSGISRVPDERAKYVRSDYAQSLRADYQHFCRQAEEGQTLYLVESQFSRYREDVAKHTRAYLTAKSCCLSPWISGWSNFPVQRQKERYETARKRLQELNAFRAWARAAVLRMLRPDLQVIRSSYINAIKRLNKELADLEAARDRMKAANAAIRQHRKAGTEAQIEALVDLGISPTIARELLTPDDCGRTGFAKCVLHINSDNIRRVRALIKAADDAQLNKGDRS